MRAGMSKNVSDVFVDFLFTVPSRGNINNAGRQVGALRLTTSEHESVRAKLASC